MALIHDYRPRNIKEFYGNKALKQSLESVLKKADRPHVYLFTGNSGCGKTTLARIVANYVECHESEFYELNAASIRGIDNIRDIENKLRYKPINGSVRVWLLDEVHQYRTDTQEAMLKMLEECPPHTYFILCTTDPQKLKATLKTRCTTFEVKPLEPAEMTKMLEGVIEEEGKEVPASVIESIVDTANGGSRAALQILERIINLPQKAMEAAAKETVESEAQTIDLCRVLMKKGVKWKDVISILSTVTADPEQIRYAVLGYCQSILMKHDDPKAYVIMSCFREPFYNTGKPGLVMACYEAINGD